MPIYEYEPCSGECRVCKGGFTLTRPLSAPPVVNCPLCRQPVRKLISAVSSPKITKPLSVSAAKNAGFKIFKKVGSGEYERQ
ncbi:MAG: FmdB family zinc ribbon protein [Verrucomicrobiota bacterium]|jgi:putative FmdB family regulatory protein|nr:zinc ribbon domain-containing protein [Pseudomonadota bacterium]